MNASATLWSADFTESVRRAMPFWDSMAPGLRDALYSAWQEARDKGFTHVHKLHLLRALLSDGRVRSHVTLMERDIGKLESLITYQIYTIGVPPRPQPGPQTPKTPASLDWDRELLEILGNANQKASLYRHGAIDVWLVFDLLRCETDLKGYFEFSKSGFADDHDTRIAQITELYGKDSARTSSLETRALALETTSRELTDKLAEVQRKLQEIERLFQSGSIKRVDDMVVRVNQLETTRVAPIDMRLQALERAQQLQQYQVNPLITELRAQLASAQRSIQSLEMQLYRPPSPAPGRPGGDGTAGSAGGAAASAAGQKGRGLFGGLFGGKGGEPDGPAAPQPMHGQGPAAGAAPPHGAGPHWSPASSATAPSHGGTAPSGYIGPDPVSTLATAPVGSTTPLQHQASAPAAGQPAQAPLGQSTAAVQQALAQTGQAPPLQPRAQPPALTASAPGPATPRANGPLTNGHAAANGQAQTAGQAITPPAGSGSVHTLPLDPTAKTGTGR